jgi:hypothetical protein
VSYTTKYIPLNLNVKSTESGEQKSREISIADIQAKNHYTIVGADKCVCPIP